MGLRKTAQISLLNKNIHVDSELTLEEYCEFLHGGNTGFVTVTTQDTEGNWTERTHPIEDWKKHIISNENKGCFASVATFFVPRRTLNTIREISMLYVDIDTRDAGISNEEAIEQIDFLVEMERLPEPTMIIASGGSRGGLYALWKIESVPARFKRVQQLYKYIENTLISTLEEVGADDKAADPTRVLRIPGSYNEKYKQEVSVIRFNEQNHYTLRFFQDFANELNGIDWEETQQEIKERKKRWKEEKKLRKQNKKEKPKNTKITKLFNRYTLAIARSHDFEKLIELRNQDLSGMANTILHMYAIEQMKIHQDKLVMKDKLHYLNDKLKNSQDKKSIQYMADSVARHYESWNYYNSTIIKKLKITVDEMTHLKTLIDANEKNERKKTKNKANRRNEQGLTAREQAKAELVTEIQRLKAKGLTQKEVSGMLEKGIATIKRHWNA